MALPDIFRSRFLRLVLVVGVSLTGILSGLLWSFHVTQPTPACVIFIRGGSSDLFQLNVATHGVDLYRPGFDTDFAHHTNQNGVEFSPDGRYFTHYDYETGILQIGNAATHKLYVVERNLLLYTSGYDWSPDGNTLDYILQDYGSGSLGDATLVMANPANNQKRSLYLGAYPNDDLILAGWSADGEYVAFVSGLFAGGNPSGKGEYRFVSVRDWKILPITISAYITVSSSEAPMELNIPVWSPQGHNFAYVTPGPNNYRLTIATPENGVQQAIPLDTSTAAYFSGIDWSPDGRYVETAVNNFVDDENWAWRDHGYWHVYFLGVDGTALPDILQENMIGSGSDVAEGWWSADSRAWVFWHSFYMQGLDEANRTEFSYLMAFYPDERRFEVLTSDVTGYEFLEPIANGKAFIAQIGLDAKSQKIVLVSADGKKPLTILDDAHDMTGADVVVWDTVGAVAIREHNADDPDRSLVVWTWADGSGRQTLSRESFPTKAIYEDLEDTAHSWIDVVPSPAGNKVAVTFADGSGQDTIALMSPDSGQAIRLWHGERANIGMPMWSPDGSMLAFVEQGKNPTIYLFAADGSAIKNFSPLDQSIELLGWTWCV